MPEAAAAAARGIWRTSVGSYQLEEAVTIGCQPERERDPEQKIAPGRDLLFVDDAVDALVRSGERGSGLVINIGTGEQTTIRDLWSMVSGGRGTAPRFVSASPNDVTRFAVSPVRARIHLSWSPWTALTDGLTQSR